MMKLSSGKYEVKKDSTIYKLDPILEDGLLKIGGRLSKAAMPEETKHCHPIQRPTCIHSNIKTHEQVEAWWKKPNSLQIVEEILDYQC